MRGKIETLPGNYPQYYDLLYQAIVQGTKLPVTGEEATVVIRVIEAAMESSRDRKTVSLHGSVLPGPVKLKPRS